MFIYDDQSSHCWFNPASFESRSQFYLVGVVVGLAIYNSTILDLPLPLAAYKKLLGVPVALEDLAAFRPVSGSLNEPRNSRSRDRDERSNYGVDANTPSCPVLLCYVTDFLGLG